MTKSLRPVKQLCPLLLLLALGACGTIEGAGRDLQNAGASMSAEARRAENRL